MRAHVVASLPQCQQCNHGEKVTEMRLQCAGQRLSTERNLLEAGTDDARVRLLSPRGENARQPAHAPHIRTTARRSHLNASRGCCARQNSISLTLTAWVFHRPLQRVRLYFVEAPCLRRRAKLMLRGMFVLDV